MAPNATLPAPSPLWTPKEAAAFARTTVGNLEQMRAKGDGPPYVKRGRRCFYLEADVRAWALGERFTSTAAESVARNEVAGLGGARAGA